jgi:hypothetical protein
VRKRLGVPTMQPGRHRGPDGCRYQLAIVTRAGSGAYERVSSPAAGCRRKSRCLRCAGSHGAKLPSVDSQCGGKLMSSFAALDPPVKTSVVTVVTQRDHSRRSVAVSARF